MFRHNPMLHIVLAFTAGIFLQEHFREYIHWFYISFVPVAAFALLLRHRSRTGTVLLLGAFILLGGIHAYNSWVYADDHIWRRARGTHGQTVHVGGVVVSDLKSTVMLGATKTSFELDVSAFNSAEIWQKTSGRLLVNLFRREDLSVGDYVLLKGKLHRPFDFKNDRHFSYRKFLERKGIPLILSVKNAYPVIKPGIPPSPVKRSIWQLRRSFQHILTEYLSPNAAGVMKAMLLGDRTEIPDHIREMFSRTGTAHILAISGLHIGIITGIIFLMLRLLPVPRLTQYWGTVLLLALYVFLAGARPSVVRAAVMSSIFLFGFVLEREHDGINSLALAAFALLLVNPMYLYDVGFQLSFLSVFFIIVIFRLCARIHPELLFNRHGKWVQYSVQSLIVSFSAWVGVGGLIAYYFGVISPVTLLANFLIVPLMSILVSLGLILLAAGTVSPWLAACVAACLKCVLNLMVVIIYLMDRIPGASFSVYIVNYWYIVLYYVLGAGLLAFFYKLTNQRGYAKV